MTTATDTLQIAKYFKTLDFTEQQVRFYDEISRSFGKTAEADSTSTGSLPHYAVDRNPHTVWEAPAGSVLEVDLGSVMNIDHFAVESALFEDPADIITCAEMQVRFTPEA